MKQSKQGQKPERNLVSRNNIILALGLALATGISSYFFLRTTSSDITGSTVMITNMAGNSGGSGSIIASSRSESLVLTNSHVCEIAKKGALVQTNSGQRVAVKSYQQSLTHDLCLIKVSARLGGKVNLASEAPAMFEKATVSGHPALLPNVVTEGHFSSNQMVDVFIGIRACTQAERTDEDLALICAFFGGLPVIRTYETTLVTATIMPGSSGSAVYNAGKELSAVVFAGSGDIGYAFTVPYEYVDFFLRSEINSLPELKPNYTLDIAALIREQNQQRDQIKTIEANCNTKVTEITDMLQRNKVEKMCATILRDFNWRN